MNSGSKLWVDYLDFQTKKYNHVTIFKTFMFSFQTTNMAQVIYELYIL
jgi:hypothetical protein